MAKFIGLDVHKRVVQAAVLHDDTGEVEEGFRFDCTPAALREFCGKHVAHGDSVALESTTNCWAVAAILREFTDKVMVSNPLRTKLIAQSKHKCDRVDALVLAQLLAADFLPGVWEPDAATREKRELSSRRAALVQDRTAIKNRLHAVLAQRLLSFEGGRLFSKAGLEYLKTAQLDTAGRACLDADLALLEGVEAQIAKLDQLLVKLAHGDVAARLLVTLPGFDFAGAVAIVAATGDIKRFPDGKRFAAYFGLVPSTKQSADTTYHGPITKQGRSHARWVFCQAAQHLANNPGPLGAFFRRIASKKNRNVAVVACAHKLAVIAWHLLTKQEPYRYADPFAVAAKLSRIRVCATGKQRRRGPAKGAPQAVNETPGLRWRSVKSLDDVLAAEGMPARTAPPPGEAAFLERQGLSDAVAALTAARRWRRAPTTHAADGHHPSASDEGS